MLDLGPAPLPAPDGVAPGAVVADLDARELQALSRLASDHAAWQLDAIVLSPTARSWLDEHAGAPGAAARRIFGFWDHAVRELATRLGTLAIDAAGAYRLLGHG